LPEAEKGKAFWADGKDGNSVNEIARTLFGRVGTLGMTGQTVPPVATPGCDQTNTNFNGEVLKNVWNANTAPAGLSLRGTDISIRTAKQSLAEALLGRAGFFPNMASGAAVNRTTMQQRLLDKGAAAAGQTSTAFQATPEGQAVIDQLATLSDDDLRVAGTRQAVYLGMLSNNSLATSGTTTQLSLLGSTATAAAGGVLTDDLLPRTSTPSDVLGSLARVQTATQCVPWKDSPATPPITLYGDSTMSGRRIALGDATNFNNIGRPATTTTAPFTASGPFTPMLRSYQFENVFAVGQAIRDRLVRLRAAIGNTAGVVGAKTEEDNQARMAAIVETEAWAGGTRAIIGPHPSNAALYQVQLVDIDPLEYGLPAAPVTADLTAAFALVVEPDAGNIATQGDLALLSQCASGARTVGCPANRNNYLWRATGASFDTTTTSGANGASGRFRNTIVLDFPKTGTVGNVPANVSPVGTTMLSVHVMRKALVRLRSNGSDGLVLGATRGVSGSGIANNLVTVLTISPMQRNLVNEVFGYGTENLTQPENSCIPGIPRNLFVPLENELNSDGDTYESSWRYYLKRAKEDAAKADELGRELIELGTRIEDRKEAASDEANALLGGNFDRACLDDVPGQARYSKCPRPLQLALSDEKVDVVLIGGKPKTTLWSVLGCGSSSVPAESRSKFCATLGSNSSANEVYVDSASDTPLFTRVPGKVYYTALGLVPAFEPPQPANLSQCQNPFADPEAFLAPTASNGQGQQVDTWASNDSIIRDWVQQARMTVGNDGHFSLSANGFTLADSAPRSPVPTERFWPECLASPNPTTTCGFGGSSQRAQINSALNAIFRTCSGNTTTALGAGCDGANASAEINGLRWRISGALWTAMALSGRIPQGAFTLPVPAVNAAPGSCALPVTIYGSGQFAPVAGSPGTFTPTGTGGGLTADDVRLLRPSNAPIVSVNPAFGTLPPSSAAEMPAWYRIIYEPNPFGDCWRTGNAGLSYVHVQASTPTYIAQSQPLAIGLAGLGAAGAAGGDTLNGVTLEGWRALARASKSNNSFLTDALASAKTSFRGAPHVDYYRERATRGGSELNGEYAMIGAQFGSSDRGFSGGIYYRGPEGITPDYGDFRPSPRGIGEELPTAYRWTGVDQDPIYERWKQTLCFNGDPDRDQFGECAWNTPDVKPTVQPPAWRARFFLNSLAPKGIGEAKRQFAGAMGLSCVLSTVPFLTIDSDSPPPMQS
jgi:hypothetical protein